MSDFDTPADFERLMMAVERGDAVAAAFDALADNSPIGPGARGLIAQIAIDYNDRSLLHEIGERLRAYADLEAPWPMDVYHLGNVLQCTSEIDGCEAPDLYLEVQTERREGRRALALAGRMDDDEHATKALTNLGNWLDSSGRWVEAYDVYQRALERDPTNGMAYGNAAEVLFWRSAQTHEHQPHLYALGCRYAHLERTHREATLRYGGPAAAAHFDQFPTAGGRVHPQANVDDPYARWVSEERLALGLTVEGVAVGPQWDDVSIARLHLAPDQAGPEIPPIFAMVNTVKQDFLLARRLAFDALLQSAESDSSTYADTLDYAVYGQLTALLTLAQRAALDLLDRLAVLVNDYLREGLSPSKVSFRTFWTGNRQREWRPRIREELELGNRSLLALADLSFDLDDGGYLAPYKSLRNAGTHRFVVLHDYMIGSHAASDAVEHIELLDFEESLLATLRIARAAIIYVVELIRVREDRIAPDGSTVYLEVPDHGSVRGYDREQTRPSWPVD